jgi:hypothetical protein
VGIGFEDDAPLLDCHLHQLVQPDPAPDVHRAAGDDTDASACANCTNHGQARTN